MENVHVQGRQNTNNASECEDEINNGGKSAEEDIENTQRNDYDDDDDDENENNNGKRSRETDGRKRNKKKRQNKNRTRPDTENWNNFLTEKIVMTFRKKFILRKAPGEKASSHKRYDNCIGLVFLHTITTKYPEYARCSNYELNRGEKEYLKSLVKEETCEERNRSRNRIKKKPSEEYQNMWEGSNNRAMHRFQVLQTTQCNSLQSRVFESMSSIRNAFTKRVLLTVHKFIYDAKSFGLQDYDMEDKLNAVHDLVKNGINRNRDDGDTFITMPIFHAFSIKQEMEQFKSKTSQANLLSQLIKPSEYAELDGKIIEDILLETDVAMIITVIANNLYVKDDEADQPIKFPTAKKRWTNESRSGWNSDGIKYFDKMTRKEKDDREKYKEMNVPRADRIDKYRYREMNRDVNIVLQEQEIIVNEEDLWEV